MGQVDTEIFEIDHANCTGGNLCDINSCNLSNCTTLTQVLDPKKLNANSKLCPTPGLCLELRGNSEDDKDPEEVESGSLGLTNYRNFNLLSISTMMVFKYFL